MKRSTSETRDLAVTLKVIFKAHGIEGVEFPHPFDKAEVPIEAMSAIAKILEEEHQPRDHNARFEATAAAFQRETGMLAPGKDQPAAMGGSPTLEERTAAWEGWLLLRRGGST